MEKDEDSLSPEEERLLDLLADLIERHATTVEAALNRRLQPQAQECGLIICLTISEG